MNASKISSTFVKEARENSKTVLGDGSKQGYIWDPETIHQQVRPCPILSIICYDRNLRMKQ